MRKQLFACLWSPACQTEDILKKKMMETPSRSLAARTEMYRRVLVCTLVIRLVATQKYSHRVWSDCLPDALPQPSHTSNRWSTLSLFSSPLFFASILSCMVCLVMVNECFNLHLLLTWHALRVISRWLNNDKAFPTQIHSENMNRSTLTAL